LNKSLIKNHLNENELSNGGGGDKVQAITMPAVKAFVRKNTDYENHCKSPPTSKRLYSNSSGEYMDYLDKLRSISPLRRPAFLVKPRSTSTEKPQSNHVILNEEETKALTGDKSKKLNSKKLKKLFNNKKNKSTNTKCSMKTNLKLASTQTQTYKTHAHAPKIVIDSLYDEENEFKMDNDLIAEKNPANESPSSSAELKNLNTTTVNNTRERQFKLSSSSSLLSNTFDFKSNAINNTNNTSNDIIDIDLDEEQEQQENAHQIAYL
jgi:hypothetical protein